MGFPELQWADEGPLPLARTDAAGQHLCDLCAEPIPSNEFDPETLRATGFAVCVRCIEDSI